MALRLRTKWFDKEAARSPAEQASVLAAALWKLADRLVENLAKGGYTIGTLQRGCGLLAEVLAFAAHCCDRLAHGHVGEAQRAALIQATGERLASLMQANLCELGAASCADTREQFIALVNRRAEEYSEFRFPDGQPEYGAVRLLALQIRERMDERDQPWVMDQLMEIEVPALLADLRRTFSGLLL
jgi:hypothetical protein